MPDLHNHTDRPIETGTGHIVPAGGSLHVSAATLDRLGQEPYTRGQMRRGNLTVTADALGDEPLTRTTIAKARKSELVEIIEAHGANAPEDAKADELRELAARVVFVDL